MAHLHIFVVFNPSFFALHLDIWTYFAIYWIPQYWILSTVSVVLWDSKCMILCCMLCHCYLHCIFICFADFTTVCLLFLQLAIPEFCILNSNLTPTLNLTPVCHCLSTILTEFDLHFMAFFIFETLAMPEAQYQFCCCFLHGVYFLCIVQFSYWLTFFTLAVLSSGCKQQLQANNIRCRRAAPVLHHEARTDWKRLQWLWVWVYGDSLPHLGRTVM